MILVTGGTGLVGSHLLYQLSKGNQPIKATYREASSFENVKSVFRFLGDDENLSLFKKIEWVKASVLDIPELSKIFEGITQVYHCGALVSFLPSDFDILIKTNVEGTANIVNLCIAYKVKKLCYVSSVATLSSVKNRPANEDDIWNPEEENNVYAISKNGGEMEVWRGSQEGLDVVVVNPSVIIGYGFPQKGTGQIFEKVKKGLYFYPQGSTGWVYVEDVAKAMILLMNSNIVNQRFILNSENLSYHKILTTIAQTMNVPPPQKAIPKIVLQIAWRIDAFISFLGIKKRSLTKLLARSLNNSSEYNGNKITKSIDFQYTDIKTAIEKIVH